MNGFHLTAYLSSTWRTDVPAGGPYEASCAGFIGRIGKGNSSDTITCDNFEAEIFAPNGAGKDFTFTGLDSFDKAGGVSAVSGSSSPAWLTYGAYAPEPTTTTTVAATTTSTIAPATTVAPSTTTLPATGTGWSRSAILLAIALIGAGTALLRTSRHRVTSNATRPPSR